jgi:hypothetical protein
MQYCGDGAATYSQFLREYLDVLTIAQKIFFYIQRNFPLFLLPITRCPRNSANTEFRMFFSIPYIPYAIQN